MVRAVSAPSAVPTPVLEALDQPAVTTSEPISIRGDSLPATGASRGAANSLLLMGFLLLGLPALVLMSLLAMVLTRR